MLWCDESVFLREVRWWKVDHAAAMPPTLFIDDYNVMREVSKDLKGLKAGHHLVVGLSMLGYGVVPALDKALCVLTSWEVYRLFHHFILIDDVAYWTNEGPVTEKGAPVRIAEYSATLPEAMRRLTLDATTPYKLWCNFVRVIHEPARFHTRFLRQYLPFGRPAGGIFVFDYDEGEDVRMQARDAALDLLSNNASPPYHIFSHNCEHVAFYCRKGGRWVSPQVANTLWNCARIGLQLFAAPILVLLAHVPHHSTVKHILLVLIYHMFSTIPCTFQVLTHLVRTCVNLTLRKELLELSYDYLIVKEVLRAVFGGGLGVTIVAILPRVSWELGMGNSAAILSVIALGMANLIFNFAHHICIRLLLKFQIGVPIPVFHDERYLRRKKT